MNEERVLGVTIYDRRNLPKTAGIDNSPSALRALNAHATFPWRGNEHRSGDHAAPGSPMEVARARRVLCRGLEVTADGIVPAIPSENRGYRVHARRRGNAPLAQGPAA